MDPDPQKCKAQAFRAMHTSNELLVLPNAWDVISARIIEQQGCRAIATTSAGVAAVLGYADGQRMTLEENLDIAGRIARSTTLPVSVDLEAGYASSPDGVAESAATAWNVGCVGLNLEDGTGDPSSPLLPESEMVERIRAVRSMADVTDRPIVINARTDGFLEEHADISDRLAFTIARGRAYAAAGADCIFVPDVGMLIRETIAALVEKIEAPINILVGTHTPDLSELESLGVARVSFGPRPFRATLALLKQIAQEVIGKGTCDLMTQDTITYAEVNNLLEPGFHGSCGGSNQAEHS